MSYARRVFMAWLVASCLWADGGYAAAPSATARRPNGNVATSTGKATGAPVTMLFGVALRGRSRDALLRGMRSSVKGLHQTAPDDFAGSAVGVFDSADVIAVHFRGEQFAFLDYAFPSPSQPADIVRLVDRLREKYGDPSKIVGDLRAGPLRFFWSCTDGILIVLARNWPDADIHLVYTDPVIMKKVHDAAEASEQQREASHW